jgi:hypothetical protein
MYSKAVLTVEGPDGKYKLACDWLIAAITAALESNAMRDACTVPLLFEARIRKPASLVEQFFKE